MYTSFYHLTEPPFAITPNPRYIFLSRRHQEALAHLLFSSQQTSSLTLLTGEVGTGKTTLSRCLIEQIPAHVDLALIFNPRLSALELVATICDELKVLYPKGRRSLKVLIDAFNQHLLNAHTNGRTTVLVIDEAQNLGPELLEQVRLLTNLETATHKLLHIILIGQPELVAMLEQPQLRQLAQRITARYHIAPLDAVECGQYIRHRLAVAGCLDPLFSASAIRLIHRQAQGIPRLINKICDRALLGGYTLERRQIGRDIIAQAVREVQGELSRSSPSRHRLIWVGATVLAVLAGAWWFTVGGPTGMPWGFSLQGAAVSNTGQAGAETGQAGAETGQAGAETGQAGVSAVSEVSVSAVSPPMAAEPHAASALALLMRNPALGYEMNTALGKLYSASRPATPVAEVSCQQAPLLGVACLTTNGSWRLLRALPLPAILRLNPTPQENRLALLLDVQENTVRLGFADQELVVQRAELERYWLGKIHLLWRPPFAEFKLLKKNMRGEGVLWLRKKLVQHYGADNPVAPEPALFDAPLEERLLRFQWENGLEPDGMAGALSFLILDQMQP